MTLEEFKGIDYEIKYEIEKEQNCDPEFVTVEESTIRCSENEMLKRLAKFINEHPNIEVLDYGCDEDTEKDYFQFCEINRLTNMWYTMTIYVLGIHEA